MDTDTQKASLPWQPLTLGGVAAFAQGPSFRLFLVALAVAVTVAASVVSFFYLAWEPALRQSIHRLPDEGFIRSGRLEWNGANPVRLAEGNFLSIVVDLASSGELGYAADLQCEFGRTEFRLRSLLGYIGIPYPTPWVIAFNRRELEPRWGAWHPMVAASLGMAVVAGLLVVWGVLGACYALPIQLISFYADRQANVFTAWRLGVASLLSSALLMAAVILAYGFQRLNLIQLLFAAAIHVILPWFYVVAGPLWLPRQRSLPGSRGGARNPFRTP